MISENDNIKTNSLEAWILAARPKTLTGASVPVMIGVALAIKTAGWHDFMILPAVLCFLFAFLMQIDSNLINDYFDCVHGNDDVSTRLGPKRACAEGWITLPVMRRGLVIVSIVACLVGLPLIWYGGWEMIIVGAICVLFAFLYTTFFSYIGLGDLLVLVFFGIVPVYFTWYVTIPESMQGFDFHVLIAGISCGLVIDTLLLVNNYRDRDNDRRDGKKTLVVRLGAKWGERLYRELPNWAEIFILGSLIFDTSDGFLNPLIFILLSLIYEIPHTKTTEKLIEINHGKELNKVLGMTARDMFIFGLVTSVQILLLYNPMAII